MAAIVASTLRYSSFQCAINDRSSQGTRTPKALNSWFSSPLPTISFLRALNFRPRDRFQNGFISCSFLPTSSDSSSSERVAVLLEVDGVLMDAYQSGNRQAFNVAFRKLGLDCANWTEPIYTDLIRRGDGNEERMLALYFNRIGWPTSLPTSEKESFMKSVLQEKKKAVVDILISMDTPLRPGVEKFIDDALHEGLIVVIVIAFSKFGEETARAIVEKLGHQTLSKVKIVGKKEISNSFFGQLERGIPKLSGPFDDLANEASKAAAAEKKRIAEDVAFMLKLRVDINTIPYESMQEIVTALRAGAENADVAVCNCVLVAGSQLAVAAAEIIGMPCFFLRSRLTSREELPSSVSVMDGFGNAYLTISKIRSKLSSSSGR